MNIIPKPSKCTKKEGSFSITENTIIQTSTMSLEMQKLLLPFVDKIYKLSHIKIPIKEYSEICTNVINIDFIQTGLGKEGYKLEISSSNITIKAEALNGVFYCIQTIFQLLPIEIFGEKFINKPLVLQCCEIIDNPCFIWRGMHLDVSRHFFNVKFIKKYIDYLAMHKMNIFHWHLTDDNGWRIEIKKYPKLTEIGAWRASRDGIGWRDCKPQQPGEKTIYGGYYTQQEIKKIVQYANDRFITIIPEIEMPGHTLEVLAAYPELGCTGGPYTVATGTYWPNKDIFCAGNEEVFVFLKNVLNEVLELFPGKYIHIGGDEVNKEEWKKCSKCLTRMQKENLQNVEELQSWFIKRIGKYLHSKNRKLIGWDEILEGGLAPNAAVMSWQGEKGGIQAAKIGHDVVMSPGTHCYFDHYQDDPETEPKAIGGYTTLKKVYSYEPIPKELTKRQAKHILGAQANVWTEWMETPEHIEYMIFPRITALAEVLWSTIDNKNWEDFKERLQKFLNVYRIIGINYHKSVFEEQ
ncbi:MAG: beta-N-acetylhexosaminidase [Candidatus Tenebribacter mawsonii]|nr:beta-N-acetylhexosaminidase [Candidatus Tenebribacter mawsonii]